MIFFNFLLFDLICQYKMKNILITGGTGFIGSHTCIELIKKGYKLTILDSLVNSKIETISRIKKILENDIPKVNQNIELKVGDIRDFKFVEKVFSSNNNRNQPFDGVIHFCGLKSVNDSIKKPIEYWDVNVLGTINLVKVMMKYECFSLVFSSSATVYGNPKRNPIREEADIQPITTYGLTKSATESFLFDIQKQYSSKLRVAILRYFNPVGAHESGLMGELPLGKPNNIFPLLNFAGIGINKTFQIYGNDWPTKDGTCIRDYIHVMDIASGHVSALNYLFRNKAQVIVLNLGTGKGTSVLELVNTYQIVNKVRFEINFIGRRDGDIIEAVANNLLAKEKLNWEPTKSIQDMCRDGFKWQKNLRDIT